MHKSVAYLTGLWRHLFAVGSITGASPQLPSCIVVSLLEFLWRCGALNESILSSLARKYHLRLHLVYGGKVPCQTRMSRTQCPRGEESIQCRVFPKSSSEEFSVTTGLSFLRDCGSFFSLLSRQSWRMGATLFRRLLFRGVHETGLYH